MSTLMMKKRNKMIAETGVLCLIDCKSFKNKGDKFIL
jgi:hypothetical protein